MTLTKAFSGGGATIPNSTSEERVIGWKWNGDWEVAFFKRKRSILRGHHCVLPAAPLGPSLNTGRGEREKMTLPWFLKVRRWKCFDWLDLWHSRVVFLLGIFSPLMIKLYRFHSQSDQQVDERVVYPKAPQIPRKFHLKVMCVILIRFSSKKKKRWHQVVTF